VRKRALSRQDSEKKKADDGMLTHGLDSGGKKPDSALKGKKFRKSSPAHRHVGLHPLKSEFTTIIKPS
jgi:hypothetical protein